MKTEHLIKLINMSKLAGKQVLTTNNGVGIDIKELTNTLDNLKEKYEDVYIVGCKSALRHIHHSHVKYNREDGLFSIGKYKGNIINSNFETAMSNNIYIVLTNEGEDVSYYEITIQGHLLKHKE